MISARALAAYARLFGHEAAPRAATAATPAPDITRVPQAPSIGLRAAQTPDPLARHRQTARAAAQAYDRQPGDWTEQGLINAIVDALGPHLTDTTRSSS